jgi:hypothetical protein
MDPAQDGRLNAAENSNIGTDSILTNVRNLSTSHISDRELGSRIRRMLSGSTVDPAGDSHVHDNASQLSSKYFRSPFINPFDIGFGFDTTFGDFRGFSSRMNKLWNNMHEEMSKIDELDDFDIEDSHDEKTPRSEQSSSYTKYSSSVTSYGTDGVRKSKSVSGVEKVKNGKRSVHTKMVTQNGNDTTIEEVLPNGDKKLTTRKGEDKMIENH